MEQGHFYALLILLILFVLSLIFRKSGIMHLITLGYACLLGWVAIAGAWEMLLFAPIVGVAILSLILFSLAMLRGEWY